MKEKYILMLLGAMIVGLFAFFREDATIADDKKTEPRTSMNTVNLKDGHNVFLNNCAACHGVEANGGLPEQPMGGMTAEGGFVPPALNGTGHSWHHPDKLLLKIIKNGSFEPTSPMRGFKDKLSNDDIHNVLAYIKSLWPKQIRKKHAIMSARAN